MLYGQPVTGVLEMVFPGKQANVGGEKKFGGMLKVKIFKKKFDFNILDLIIDCFKHSSWVSRE